MLKRRTLIRDAAIAGSFLSTIAACTPQQDHIDSGSDTEPQVQWRMGTSWPESLDILFGGAIRLCQRVATITGGEFVITPYPSGDISTRSNVVDAVIAGNIECAHTSSQYAIDQQLALAFAACVPFGFNAQQQNAWFFRGGGLDIISALYRDLGLIHLPVGNTGPRLGGWMLTPIESVDDFSALTMRSVGIGAQVLARLGAEIVALDGTEIVSALESGRLNAAEWSGAYDDRQLGLQKVAALCHYPGWWSPSETIAAVINLDAWNQLPASYQQALQLAGMEANTTLMTRYTFANSRALEQLKRDGTALVAYPTELLNQIRSITFEFYEETASQDAVFKHVYEDWKRFYEQINRWHTVNEASFAGFSFLR